MQWALIAGHGFPAADANIHQQGNELRVGKDFGFLFTDRRCIGVRAAIGNGSQQQFIALTPIEHQAGADTHR
ncbi:hypothetical protein D3C79_904190 [compost metagenome]